MAEATREEDVVVLGHVWLKLTTDEAQAIADIFARIGGQPDTTRRGLVRNIANALNSVGVRANYDNKDFDERWSELRFK